MSKDNPSLLTRLRQFLQIEPQNQHELVTLLREANSRQLINHETLAMIESVLQFAQMQVRDIMLPKKQMSVIPAEATFEQVVDTITQTGHSRFPVIEGHTENILGILHAKDLFRFQLDKEPFNLLDVIRTATFIPHSKRLDLLLSEFRYNRNHMAVVVDEYGLVDGFITIEDIIEQIIGDIEDEFDYDEESYIKAHGSCCYIIKAHMPIEAFNQELKTTFTADIYETVGGMVVRSFGYLPKRGETIDIQGFEFEIMQADARKIKLLSCIDNRIKDTSHEK